MAYKEPSVGRFVKILDHKSIDRGLFVAEQSRCLRQGEVHELVITDQIDLVLGSRVDRVGFLGFVEIQSACVIEVGDEAIFNDILVGRVVGFDSCHFPNHYNILIEAETIQTGATLGLRVGNRMIFKPARHFIDLCRTLPPATVIVGFGRAGKMHQECLLKAINSTQDDRQPDMPIIVLEAAPDRAVAGAAKSPIRFVSSIDQLPFNGTGSIAHLCTPPAVRCQVFHDLLGAGVRQFIFEKPMVSSADELDSVRCLQAETNAKILVVANWTVSALTRSIQALLSPHSTLEIREIRIVQRKSRIGLSRESQSHISPFETELPHMVALACLFGGAGVKLLSAASWDLEPGGEALRGMGGAKLALQSEDGWSIDLLADHVSPIQERSILIKVSDGTFIQGYFPCSRSDHFSQLIRRRSDGSVFSHEYYHDDTLTTFIHEAYRYFLNGGPKPKSDLEFNVQVCQLLEDARSSCANALPHSFLELAYLDRQIRD
jgi:predicted dehydrogenase